MLAIGSAVSGLLAYAFFAMSTRALGPAAASPVSILWTYWGLAGAAITFPIQHWVTRSVARNEDLQVKFARRYVWLVVGVAALVGTAIAWAQRELLFERADAAFPLLLGLVTMGSCLVGFSRGGLAGRQQYRRLAASLVMENASRTVMALLLAAGSVADAAWFGVTLILGQLVGLLWPSALSMPPGEAGGGRAALSFLGRTSSGQLTSQLVLTSGPLIVAVLGGAPATVTSLFAALALYRAPYLVTLGVLPRLTERVSRRVALTGFPPSGRRAWLSMAGVGIAFAAAAVGASIGPAALQLIFGPGIQLTTSQSAALAAGSALATCSLVATIPHLACGNPTVVPLAWGVALAVGGIVIAVSAGTPASLVAGAFLAAEAASFAILIGTPVRPTSPGATAYGSANS